MYSHICGKHVCGQIFRFQPWLPETNKGHSDLKTKLKNEKIKIELRNFQNMPHTNFEDHQDLTHLSIHQFEFDIFHWPIEGVISSGEGVNL